MKSEPTPETLFVPPPGFRTTDQTLFDSRPSGEPPSIHRSERSVSNSTSDASRTHDEFTTAVRTAIVHTSTTIHAKGALETANHGLTGFR